MDPVDIDVHPFSDTSLKFLQEMGEHCFEGKLADRGWGSRPHCIARRTVLKKYLTNEDILAAHWVHVHSVKVNPQWWQLDLGVGHLCKIMDERSNGSWREEQTVLHNGAPTAMDYMEAEWGPPTRQMLAEQRREHFKLVSKG